MTFLPSTQITVDAGAALTAATTDLQTALQADLAAAATAFERGDLAAAEAACRRALALEPGDARALHYLGVTLVAMKRFAEAATYLRHAVEAAPDRADSHFALAFACASLDDLAGAIAHYREAVKLDPSHASAQMNLGSALLACDRFAEATTHLTRAVQLRPDYAPGYFNLGGLYVAMGRFAQAEAAHRRALELRPDYALALDGLAGALAGQGRYDEALQYYARALDLQPDSPDFRYGRSLTWLAQGRWREAWPDYEHRWCCRELKGRRIKGEPWDGSPLGGRTILLYADQALGDTLQMVRYVPLVAQRGGRVTLAIQSALVPMLRDLPGVERLVDLSQPPPPFDVQAALMSLPYVFGTTPDNVPASVPYLSADVDLVEQWREQVAGLDGFKVGLVWQGNANFLPGLRRSLSLAACEPLANLPGVRLISLQKGSGREQVAAVAFADRILDLSSRLDEESGPFMDTAAIMTQLDLVITCDTAAAHLAGALAVETWLALPAVAEWRWLLDRDDTPWYPTMRLFRQRQPGDWAEVFGSMAATLRARQPSAKRLT